MTFCDVGCGYGTDAKAVQERFPHATVFGIDQSQGMIDAAQLANPRGHFSVSAASCLPDNELFDRILVRHVLHLVPDAKACIDHILTRLTPGGRAVFVLHSNTSQPRFAEWIDWAREHFGVRYVSRSDDFCIETCGDVFNGEHRTIETKLITQNIRLTEAEPYVTYMSTQKRWDRPLSEDETRQLLGHVRRSINATLTQNGSFEETTCNGLVIIQK